MTRLEAIQKIINATSAQNYLEIGVDRGETFLAVRAPHKVAVDPRFQISRWHQLRSFWRNRHAEYHALTSDEYFRQATTSTRFDVAFIDGLHTYRQALRDVENTLRLLSSGGVIVMHDCNPPTAAAAHPGHSPAEIATLNLPGWNWSWCGDVWKTICHLRSQRRDLKVFVLDADFGLGIITRGPYELGLSLSEPEIEAMTYADLDRNRRHLLNLKPASYLADFFARRS